MENDQGRPFSEAEITATVEDTGRGFIRFQAGTAPALTLLPTGEVVYDGRLCGTDRAIFNAFEVAARHFAAQYRTQAHDAPDYAETVEEEAERETTPPPHPLAAPEVLASIADSGADAYRRGYGANRSAFAFVADAGDPDGGTYERRHVAWVRGWLAAHDAAHPTPERLYFLWDLFVAALEGGIGYWSHADEYEPGTVAARGSAGFHALITDTDGQQHRIDVAAMERGIAAIVSGRVHVNAKLRRAIAGASATLDASQLDVEAADCIVQAAALGSVIYG